MGSESALVKKVAAMGTPIPSTTEEFFSRNRGGMALGIPMLSTSTCPNKSGRFFLIEATRLLLKRKVSK